MNQDMTTEAAGTLMEQVRHTLDTYRAFIGAGEATPR